VIMTSYIASLEAAKPYLNHADHFDEKMVEGDVTLREFLSGFLSYYPSWIHTLYRIRAGFVRLLGMKQEGMPGGSRLRPEDISFQAGQMETFFKIREGSEHSYWIASAQDKHLTADLIVVAEALSESRNRFYVGTVVHYHHWTGPLYFNVIRPFHHIVVSAMSNAGVRTTDTHKKQAPRDRMGFWLMAVALLHQGVGLVFYAEPLSSIVQAGVINSVQPPFWDRDAAFWFLMFGGLLFLIGATTQWLLDKREALPRFWGWGLLVINGLGALLMPASGLWLVIVLAIVMIRQRDRTPVQQPVVA